MDVLAGPAAALSVRDLVKTYPATRKMPPVEAVRGVSFAVTPGEVFGLLGPNGAGKSTTLGCVTTLVRPTRGEIRVAGLDVERDAAAARRAIAVVPQVRNLDRDLTIRETLTFHGAYFGLGAAERQARADRLLGELEIAEKADAKPADLSGGQQQRALVARALMHEPRLLLLDEPTIGLDPQARRLLWDLVRRLRSRGITVVLTTHYMEEADALCDRVAIIDHGRILALDTPAGLKASLPTERVIDLRLRARPAAAPASTGVASRARLEAVDGVRRVEAMPAAGVEGAATDLAPGEEHVRLFVEAREGLLDRVLEAVRAGGAELVHLNLAPPSLEDVFIHLTGADRLD